MFYDESLEKLRAAFSDYVQVTTVASVIIVIYVAWNVSRSAIPSLEKWWVAKIFHYLLSIAAAIHVVIIFVLSPSHSGVTYWLIVLFGFTIAFIALLHIVAFSLRALKRYWFSSSFAVAVGPSAMIRMKGMSIPVCSVPPILSFTTVGKGTTDRIMTTFHLGDTLYTFNGSVTDSKITAWNGAHFHRFHKVKEFTWDTAKGRIFTIYCCDPEEGKIISSRAIIPLVGEDLDN